MVPIQQPLQLVQGRDRHVAKTKPVRRQFSTLQQYKQRTVRVPTVDALLPFSAPTDTTFRRYSNRDWRIQFYCSWISIQKLGKMVWSKAHAWSSISFLSGFKSSILTPRLMGTSSICFGWHIYFTYSFCDFRKTFLCQPGKRSNLFLLSSNTFKSKYFLK